MKVLFNKELPFKNKNKYRCPKRGFDLDSSGILILQQEPAERTIYCSGNGGFKKHNFPYIRFVFGYSTFKDKNGKKRFSHHGIFDGGMRVFYSKKPFSSFEDQICAAWTDLYNGGLVCTPHEYDYTLSFDNVYDLGNNYLEIYFSLSHSVPSYWKPTSTAEDVYDYLEKQWDYKDKFDTFDTLYKNTFNSPLRQNILFSEIVSISDLSKDDLIDKEWSKDFDKSLRNKNNIVESILNLQKGIRN